jgi:hypothetical protein
MLESMGASRQAAQVWRDIGDLMSAHGEHQDACMAYDRALECMGLAKAPDSAVAPKTAESQVLEFDAAQLLSSG